MNSSQIEHESVEYQTCQKRKYWSQEEDEILCQALEKHGSNWKIIAQYFIERNASQCAQRWKRIKPRENVKKRWTWREDCQVIRLASQFEQKWSQIAKFLPHRSARQIRQRYINQLNPEINRNEWTEEEDEIIWRTYQKIGSKWTEIAKKLSNRTENMIKNRYYGCIRKKFGKLENPYYVIPRSKRNIQENQSEFNLNSINYELDDNQLDEQLESRDIFEFPKGKKKLQCQVYKENYCGEEIYDQFSQASSLIGCQESDPIINHSSNEMQYEGRKNKKENIQQVITNNMNSFDIDGFQMI